MTAPGRGFAAGLVRRRRAVILGWALVGTASLPLAGRLSERLDPGTRIEGSESALVEEILERRFESPFARSALLVVSGVPPAGTPRGESLLRELTAAVAKAPGVTRTFSFLDGKDPSFLAPAGTYVVVGLDPAAGRPDALMRSLRQATQSLAGRLRSEFPGASLEWTGEGPLTVDLRLASTREARAAEARALPLTLGLLMLAFGGVMAGLLPVATGALAILTTLGAAALLAGVLRLSVTFESVASMLGLGLGIDYALLTLGRFREALGEGAPAETAAEEAARHAGKTIVVSGATVAIGFLGLLLVPLGELRSVALGGLLVVVASVALATTLLPALLAISGRRLAPGGRGPGEAGKRWRRWGCFVSAHPVAVLLLGGLPVATLAFEARRLRVELPSGDWLPAGMESSSAARALEAMGHRGIVQQVRVLLEYPEDVSALDERGWAAARDLGGFLARDPRVAQVRSLRSFAGERADDLAYVSLMPGFAKRAYLGGEGEAALLEVIPREEVSPGALARLVRDLRRTDAAAASGLPGARLRVGGLPAFNADYEDAVGRHLAAVVALVVGGTLVALALAFRSILVPLKAVGLNLLSVAAAFGAVVLVFQDGFGARWLGLAEPTGAVFPAVPVLVFAIVFGLSMDYEIFLVARVAEARRAGADEAAALAEGLARTGGVISSAAAVMVAVFGAFALGRLLLVQMLGFALAVAVLVDATLIRIAVGPALLRLAGRWNWWPGGGRESRARPART